jgi:arylsulfatase A-like enzyme
MTTIMRKSLPWILVAAVVVAAAATFYLSRRPARETVFLIVVDTLRADHLSCYGFEGHETPRIDGLAGSGVQFDHAITVGGWTVPSMGAMFTSHYPTQLGLVEDDTSPKRYFKTRERREQWEYSIGEGYTTMVELLAEVGYSAYAFVNQPVLNNNPGFAQGFSGWVHPVAQDSVVSRADPSQMNESLDWRNVYMADSTLVTAFEEWMAHAPDGKLFVYVHLLTPHLPYEPPSRFGVPATAPPADRYAGEVRYADELVGRVLDAIDSSVGLDSALVVFTADHGEELGEHGSKDHGHSLHRECVHVPLVMAGPGIPAGRHVAETVRLIDIMPTLLARCGLGSNPTGALEGIDLAAHLEGGGEELPVYTEGMLYGSTERSLMDGRWRLMLDQQGDVWSLFDIDVDPGEFDDVAAADEARVASMRARLESLHKRLVADRARYLQNEISGDSLMSVQERRRALNAMRALGYVND